MKWFKCHCCEQIIEHPKEARIGMFFGITFRPDPEAAPDQLLDFCEECTYAFLAKFREAKIIRLEQEYQKRSITWIQEKFKSLEPKRKEQTKWQSQQPRGGVSRINALLAEMWTLKGKGNVQDAAPKSRQTELSFLKEINN